jgi:hypothetical protein
VKNTKQQLMVLACCLIGLVFVFEAPAQKTAQKNDAQASTAAEKAAPTPLAGASAAAAKPEEKTGNKAFRGIVIGMQAGELRKKLGTPKDAGDTLDFYVFSDNESAQIVYDASHAVSAVSFDFTGKSGAPAAKDVLGVDVDVSTDGSMYKMIRYPKSGYWISYNRTAGDSGMVSITMQKIP